MPTREYDVLFDGQQIFDIVEQNVRTPTEQQLDRDFFVFFMGPFTAFDAREVFTDAGELKSPFIDDPLFDEQRHLTDDGRGDYEKAIRELSCKLSNKYGVRAFLATDVNIPTPRQASPSEPSMSVLSQSIALSAISDAVVFIFTNAGLTAGVSSEVGAVLARFNLHFDDPDPPQKPRERFRIFIHERFRSASIESIPSTFGVDVIEFTQKDELLSHIQQFLVNVERNDSDRILPIYSPKGI